MLIADLSLLAELPASGAYIDPLKLGAIVVVFTLWAAFAAWVDKDTIAVNTFRVLWNLLTLGAGLVAFLLVLFVPVFAIGFPVFLVLNLIAGIMYVVHRNGLVKADDRVFTIGHLKRLREQGFSKKKKQVEVREKVRLTAHNRKVVEIPAEDPEREQYRLTQDLMFDAFWRRSAITEITPAGPQASKIIFQVDGLAIEGQTLPRPDADAIVQYVKQLAGLNIEERRKPQKGMIMAAIGGDKHKVIVRTDGSTAGEKLYVRIIGKEAEFKVPDLGLTPRQLELAQATKEESKGLILISAPPGCGLTTSVYSFTRNHDRFLQNVQTVEYEKELDLDNVTQNLYTPGDGPTFSERLLKLVRSDPDIIVLPDLREREGAAIASKAAAEKQKVYVAVSATDIMDALRKWIGMVSDKALVAKSLLAVTNQRLVRVLCPTCKQAYKPNPDMMRKLNLPEDKVLYRPPEPVFDKKGEPIICPACQGTGYFGRTGVFDWLSVDEPLREVIRRSKSMTEIQAYLQKRLGLGLQAQALQKVLDGVTSIQEVARAVRGNGGAASGKTPAAGPQPQPQPRPQPKPPAAAGGAQPQAGR